MGKYIYLSNYSGTKNTPAISYNSTTHTITYIPRTQNRDN